MVCCLISALSVVLSLFGFISLCFGLISALSLMLYLSLLRLNLCHLTMLYLSISYVSLSIFFYFSASYPLPSKFPRGNWPKFYTFRRFLRVLAMIFVVYWGGGGDKQTNLERQIYGFPNWEMCKLWGRMEMGGAKKRHLSNDVMQMEKDFAKN